MTSDDPEITEETPRVERASRLPDQLAVISGVVIAALVLAALITLLVATRRGLDLTDESDYIQSELHAGAYIRASTEFQLLLGPVLSLVRHVWLLRVTKLLGLVAAHAFLAWCFVRTAPTLVGARFKRADRIAVSAAIIAGGLAVSRVLPQTPGYNDLTVFFVVSVSGLLLLLADRRVAPRWEPVAWFAVGVVIWLQFLARWPSTTAIVPLAAIAFLWTGTQLSRLVRRGLGVVAGVAVGAVATQLFLAPVPDILRGIHHGNADAAAALAYSRSHLLHQYVTNLSDLLRVMSHSFWYLLVAAVVVGLLIGTDRYARPAALAAAVGLVVVTPVFIHSGRAHGGVEPFGGIGLPLLLARSVLIPLYVALAVLAAAAALIVNRDTRPTWRGLVVIVALLGSPFLGGLGSNNPIWYSAALNPGLWIAAALALCALTHREHGRILVHGLAFALAALIAFTAFDGTWHHPYRQAPLAAQTTAVGISGPLSGLKVDPATASFLQQVRATADAVAAAEPTDIVVWAGLAPYNAYGLPGASVASGLSQPLFAWLSAPYFAGRSLAAACANHSRGVLLITDPSQPPSFTTDPLLMVPCAGRTWIQRDPIDGLSVQFAGPLA